MSRVYILLIALALAFTVFAFVDAVLFDRLRVRGVPKGLWIFLILLVPVIGPILWFAVGRGRKGAKNSRGQVAPDDDIEFLRGLNFPKPDPDDQPDSGKD